MRILRKNNRQTDISKIKDKIFVIDTETTCLEPQPKNFVFGVIYGHAGYEVIDSVEDFKKEFNKSKYKGNYIFAHNAEFDLSTIFGNIYQNLDNAAIFNGKFICAKYNGITFADSMNVYPSSVKKIGEVIGLSKMDNQKVSGEGLTRENMTPEDVEYCVRDCEIIYEALIRIFEMTGTIKITLAGLSLMDYRTNYLPKDVFIDPLVDDFYKSYYGGRTEAFKIGMVNAVVYDINSMYPYVMQRMKFPDPSRLRKEKNINKKFLIYLMKYYEGLASVTVRHKDCFFGYLPVKVKLNGFEKLIFPVGEFHTVVNFNELRFAVDTGAVDIVKIHYVVYGKGIESPFRDFIMNKYSQRLQTNNQLDKLIYKLQMNSLYGKFGQKLKYVTTYYPDIPYDLIERLQKKKKFVEVKTFNSDRTDCFLITENKNTNYGYYSVPLYASYITSEARLLILKNLLANETNDPVYCDTDSIFINNDHGHFSGRLSDHLGDFKLEPKQVIQIRGLKNYTYIDDKGQTFDVIKGVAKNSSKTVDFKTGMSSYVTRKYYKTLQSLRQNKETGQGYEQKKVLVKVYDKRQVLLDGSTRPLIMPLNEIIKTRKKPVVSSRIKNILANEPVSIHEAILHFFISGGRVKVHDLRRHGLKHKVFIFGKKNGTPLDLIPENFPEYLKVNENGFDIPDMILQVISEYTSKWQMITELEKTYSYEPSQMSLFY